MCEVVVRDSPPPHSSLRGDRDVFVVRVPTDVVSALFRICPLRLSFVFSSHGPLPAVVQAHPSHGLLALTSLLLEIRGDFLEGWWCVVKIGSLI